MQSLKENLRSSPVWPRVAPFMFFILFTIAQGETGEAGRYWFYVAKSFAGVWLVWGLMRPLVPEMKWVFSWEAVVVGVAVLVMWVGIDGWYPSLDEVCQHYVNPVLRAIGLGSWCQPPKAALPWNPHTQFGHDTPLAWFVIVVRIAGSSLVVPPLEEVFYRSFLYRYFAKPDFLSLPLGAFRAGSFFLTALVFGFSHHEWLAGILCAFAYQGLVIWKKRLGDAMTAHAITNFLLGVYIVWKGEWHFW